MPTISFDSILSGLPRGLVVTQRQLARCGVVQLAAEHPLEVQYWATQLRRRAVLAGFRYATTGQATIGADRKWSCHVTVSFD